MCCSVSTAQLPGSPLPLLRVATHGKQVTPLFAFYDKQGIQRTYCKPRTRRWMSECQNAVQSLGALTVLEYSDNFRKTVENFLTLYRSGGGVVLFSIWKNSRNQEASVNLYILSRKMFSGQMTTCLNEMSRREPIKESFWGKTVQPNSKSNLCENSKTISIHITMLSL